MKHPLLSSPNCHTSSSRTSQDGPSSCPAFLSCLAEAQNAGWPSLPVSSPYSADQTTNPQRAVPSTSLRAPSLTVPRPVPPGHRQIRGPPEPGKQVMPGARTLGEPAVTQSNTDPGEPGQVFPFSRKARSMQYMGNLLIFNRRQQLKPANRKNPARPQLAKPRRIAAINKGVREAQVRGCQRK